MSSLTKRESIFLRISKKCAIILELSILHEDREKQWFTEKHKQEMLELIIDAINCRFQTVKDTVVYKKVEHQKKTGDHQNPKGIIKGDTVKVGYNFSKRPVNLQCVLPTDSKASRPIAENSPYSGGGYKSLDVFPEKLNLYVCKRQPASSEQGTDTTQAFSAISTDSGYHTKSSISNYFNSETGTGPRRVGQTESAAKKMVKLKRIVNNSAKPKPSTDSIAPSAPASGGFLSDEKISGDGSQESLLKPSVICSAKPSNDYLCNSDDSMPLTVDPIYIDSEASNDSTGSHVFDRDGEGSMKSVSGDVKKMLICKDGMLQSSGFRDDEPKHQDLCQDMFQALKDRNDLGVDLEDGDGKRFSSTKYKNAKLSNSPKFKGHLDSDDDITRTKPFESVLTNVLSKSKIIDHRNPSRQLHRSRQNRLADKLAGKGDKLFTKFKWTTPKMARTARKRPLCEASDSTDDDSGQAGYPLQQSKSKRPHYSHNARTENRCDPSGISSDQKESEDGLNLQDNVQYSSTGARVDEMKQSKENTKPDTVDDDVVDLCSNEEEEEEERLPSDNNESLLDVIGDKRDVRHLNDGDVAYLMRRNIKYFKNIFAGKVLCQRHQNYKAGGFRRSHLDHGVRFGPFTDDQQDTIMMQLIRVFCRKHSQYLDYVSKVLLPEALAKICMDVHHTSHKEAEKFLRDTPSASFCM